MKKFKMKRLFFCAITFALIGSSNANAAIVDADSDGLIEINNLDDLNEIRNNVHGTSLRGNSEGCPLDTGCFGYELTRDLDFDSNGNGIVDSGDWNTGTPWVPVTANVNILDQRFSAVFDGNGHTIRNLRINTITDYRDYGFFGSTFEADIKNLGLVDSVVSVSTDTGTHIGTLIGDGYATNVSNCYVNNGVIDTGTQQLHAIGGLVGSMGRGFNSVTPTIKNSYFSGAITTGGDAAGLVSFINIVNIENSYAKGTINARFAAGLVSNVYDGSLINNFANMQITASVSAGGLVDSIGQGPASIHNSYALGSIIATNLAGGLVRSISNADVEITNSYANNLIQVGNNKYANLISYIHQNGGVSFSISNSYWVKNPQGVVLSDGSSALGNGGQLLADMQCANNSFNTACSVPGLLQDWDDTIWDFGDRSQLPVLKLRSNFPWMSTDTPGSTGDYETIQRIRERNPEYTCDTPSAFYAKEKRSGYIFNAKTPEIFSSFYTPKGFVCKNADQEDGSCSNFESSFLCKSSSEAYWTLWDSKDRPNDGSSGDYETYDAECGSTSVAGVRVRKVNKTSIYYGAPQKLSTFNLTKGLECKNDGQTCKDYEVRMTCEVLSDR